MALIMTGLIIWEMKGRQVMKMNNICSICGRVLKNPNSIAIGMGPVCAGKDGFPGTRTGRLSGSKLNPSNVPKAQPCQAIYTVTFYNEYNLLAIVDCGKDFCKKVRDEANRILEDIQKNNPERNIRRMLKILKDSNGDWLGMVWEKDRVRYYYSSAKTEQEAIDFMVEISQF